MTDWGSVLRDIREEQGISQRQLAEMGRVNRNALRRFEKNDPRDSARQTLAVSTTLRAAVFSFPPTSTSPPNVALRRWRALSTATGATGKYSDAVGERHVGIPTVFDRLIQPAVLQQLHRLWAPTFSEHSYGFLLSQRIDGKTIRRHPPVRTRKHTNAADLDQSDPAQPKCVAALDLAPRVQRNILLNNASVSLPGHSAS
jgi:transcriptional regulator with XRE-family HTH domain